MRLRKVGLLLLIATCQSYAEADAIEDGRDTELVTGEINRPESIGGEIPAIMMANSQLVSEDGKKVTVPIAPWYHSEVEGIIEAFKSGNLEMISEYISFPLRRRFPIPPIMDKREFLASFDAIFDKSLVSKIVNSNISEDWSRMGSEGIMLGNGILWIDYGGNIKAINYTSEHDLSLSIKLIESSRMKLHPSVRSFNTPVLEWRTKNYHVRVDELKLEEGGSWQDPEYRYTSWRVTSGVSDPPDLILANGKVHSQGSGGNHFYEFASGNFRYVCDVNILGKTDVPGFLNVYESDKLILSEEVTEALCSGRYPLKK